MPQFENGDRRPVRPAVQPISSVRNKTAGSGATVPASSAVGAPTGVVRDGEHIRVSAMLMDAAADLRVILVDGEEIEVPGVAAAIIEDLQRQLTATASGRKREIALLDGLEGQIDGLRAVLAMKDAEIAALRASAPSPTLLDAMAEERTAVMAVAREVCGDRYSAVSRSTLDVKRDVIAKMTDRARADTLHGDALEGAFDGVAHAVRHCGVSGARDPVRDAFMNARPSDPRGTAFDEAKSSKENYRRNLETAWSGKTVH